MNPLWLLLIVPGTVALTLLIAKIIRVERAERRHREICAELDK